MEIPVAEDMDVTEIFMNFKQEKNELILPFFNETQINNKFINIK